MQLPESFKLLLIPVIIALGVFLSRRNRELANSVTCGLGVFCVFIWLILLASGVLHFESVAQSIHHWAGVGMVLPIWISCLFAIGVTFQQAVARGVGVCAGRIAVITFVLLIGFLNSFTGYMGPARDPNLPIDSYHRFVVLHQIVLPALLFALLCLWVWLFGRDGNEGLSDTQMNNERIFFYDWPMH